MSEFFGYNSERGTWYEASFDGDGDLRKFTTMQDVQPVIDHATRRYAIIPAHVELELKQKGINIYNPNQTKELLKEINTNYRGLKTTYRTHE